MNHHLIRGIVCSVVFSGILTLQVNAQLASNPDKFLGNITTSYQIDYGNEPFYTLWNQITPENESKWDQVEGQRRGTFNWSNVDKIYKYAKDHNFPLKFHTLVWGSQYPRWMDDLSVDEQHEAIVEWMDAAQKRYPDLQMIDVVNEAIAGHAPAPYKAALGGDGKTGFDWIIKAFQMAHERWPDAILIYNDYNTFQWNTNQFIELVRILRDAGAPIDAYGCQSHDLTDCKFSTFTASMGEIQNALQMPMYSTEYDIGTDDDNLQLQRYKEQIPYIWEADYCAGITLWGYIYGKTWVTNGNSGIIKNGKDRPAMTWLREYMQTDAAKNAKSPFPGMKKEASVYVSASSLVTSRDEEVDINVNASLKTKTIDHIDLYINDQPLATLTEAPYVATYTPTKNGRYDIKAVVTATDGSTYHRLSGFTAYDPRSPFNGITELPGTIEFEHFDSGAEGMTYQDSDNRVEGDAASYRSDNKGVDIVSGNGGYAIGYTATGEWLEYTVDVKEAGEYSYEVYAASGSTGSGFSVGLVKDNSIVELCKVSVPQTANNDWNTYKAIKGTFKTPLEAGRQVLRVTIEGPYCNIDKMVLTCTSTGINQTMVEESSTSATYNLYGLKVNDNYKGIIIKNGKMIMSKSSR